MTELTIDEQRIENMIYEIRGKQVMLDSDLAILYECKNGTKEINQAVSRNKAKFPERYSWILTTEESNIFLVTICDQKIETRGGRYKNPRVFTQEGVAMLATILKTQVATKTSIQIMDAFVAMRKYISSNLMEQKYINNMVIKHDEEIRLLQTSFNKLEEKKVVNEIYFKGQIYDAYSKIKDILTEAKENIVIIDGYVDKSILDMIKDINIKITLITKPKTKLSTIDINKYNSQYNNLIIKYDNTYHDRYIIIDKKKIYHLGASINHAGSKTFSINILEDDIVKTSLIESIKNDVH